MKKLIVFLSVCLLLLIVSCGKKSPTQPEQPPQPATGSLIVKSDPGEAEIWLDEQNTGKITFGTVPGISLGQHKVTLKKSGFMNFNWNIYMTSAGLSYDVDLAPGSGEFMPDPIEDANIKKLGEFNITSDYSGDWHCVGELRNYGGRWADWIEIKFSFYDSGGNIIDTDSTYCDGTCGYANCGLKPGEKGTFELYTWGVPFSQVARYEYTITWVTRGY